MASAPSGIQNHCSSMQRSPEKIYRLDGTVDGIEDCEKAGRERRCWKLWKSSTKIVGKRCYKVGRPNRSVPRKSAVEDLPPPGTHLPTAVTGAGFAKMLCKILMTKNLEVTILTTKNLGPVSRFLCAPPPP